MRNRSPSFRHSARLTGAALALPVAALSLLAAGAARADYCEVRVESVLAALVQESPTPIGRAERTRMQTVLMGLCADAVQAGGGNAPPAAPVALAQPPAGAAPAAGTLAAEVAAEANEPAEGRNDDDEDDGEGVRILGIEFEKADPDSAGHERLRTKR